MGISLNVIEKVSSLPAMSFVLPIIIPCLTRAITKTIIIRLPSALVRPLLTGLPSQVSSLLDVDILDICFII